MESQMVTTLLVVIGMVAATFFVHRSFVESSSGAVSLITWFIAAIQPPLVTEDQYNHSSKICINLTRKVAVGFNCLVLCVAFVSSFLTASLVGSELASQIATIGWVVCVAIVKLTVDTSVKDVAHLTQVSKWYQEKATEAASSILQKITNALFPVGTQVEVSDINEELFKKHKDTIFTVDALLTNGTLKISQGDTTLTVKSEEVVHVADAASTED